MFFLMLKISFWKKKKTLTEKYKGITSVQNELDQKNNTALLLPSPKSVQNRSVKLLQAFLPGEIISVSVEKIEKDRKSERDKQIENVKKAGKKKKNRK